MPTLQPAGQQALLDTSGVAGTELGAGIAVTTFQPRQPGVTVLYTSGRKRMGTPTLPQSTRSQRQAVAERVSTWALLLGLVTAHCPRAPIKQSRTVMSNDSRKRKHQSPINNRW